MQYSGRSVFDRFVMASSPSALSFFDGPIGGEVFCRLLRASHCKSCAAIHLQCPTFVGAVCDPAFRNFLLDLYATSNVRGVVGGVDAFSRRLELYTFGDVSSEAIPLPVKCDIHCQLRFVMSGIAEAFFVEVSSFGGKIRRRRNGSDVDWVGRVVPLLSLDGLRFGAVFRHPYFYSFLSSIGNEPHGPDGTIDSYVGPSFLHFMASFRSSNEDDQVVALRCFDMADRASVEAGVLPVSQIRHSSGGAPSFYFRRAFDSSWVCDGDTYAASSPVFRFLLDCFRSGPEFRSGDADDIGAPDRG